MYLNWLKAHLRCQRIKRLTAISFRLVFPHRLTTCFIKVTLQWQWQLSELHRRSLTWPSFNSYPLQTCWTWQTLRSETKQWSTTNTQLLLYSTNSIHKQHRCNRVTTYLHQSFMPQKVKIQRSVHQIINKQERYSAMCRFQEGSNVFSAMTAHDQHIQQLETLSLSVSIAQQHN